MYIMYIYMQAVSPDYDESDYFIYFLYLLRLTMYYYNMQDIGGKSSEPIWRHIPRISLQGSTAVVATNIYGIMFYNNL